MCHASQIRQLKMEVDVSMCKRQLRTLIIVLMMITVCTPIAVRDASAKRLQTLNHAQIIKEVRHELVTLPYYGVFDWLEFEVRPDNTVVLRGQVVRPTTKSDAEARVRGIKGVKQVINEIEVLPLSPEDDRLRLALYRSIYDWDSPLFHYATQSVPPIHIIVKNGRAILKGVVATKADSDLANIRARGVPGLFDVKNELQIESERPR
jgi:hyperosmotically inducible protein